MHPTTKTRTDIADRKVILSTKKKKKKVIVTLSDFSNITMPPFF